MLRKILPLIILAALFATPAGAQAQSNDTWSTPVDLSKSGATSNPAFVVDSNGIGHVLWSDEFSGLMYSEIGPDGASAPAALGLSFEIAAPKFWLGSNDTVQAFWIDADNNLYTSSVPATDFGKVSSWRAQTLLSSPVIAYDVAVGEDGALYLAYINSLDDGANPAGVYFRTSKNGGVNWSAAKLIYESKYFRSMDSKDSNVQIAASATAQGEQVSIAWDNRPIKTIFFATSANSGQTWQPPAEVVSPETLTSTSTPFNIRIHANSSSILLVYQVGQPGLSCSQSFASSSDAGQTWGSPIRMLEDLAGCADSNQFLNTGSGDAILVSSVQGAVYLSAWDGSQWSRLQQQPEMANVTDPDTHATMPLNCLQPQLGQDGVLYVVGCDSQKGDIWWMHRQINAVVPNWFEGSNTWTSPEMISSGQEDFLNLSLISDPNGQVHALWSKSSGDLLGHPGPSIYYSRWENQQLWTHPITVQSTPQFYADQPAAVVDTAGNLDMVWRVGQKGQIYFSQSKAELAVLGTSWSEPILLSDAAIPADSPQISVARDGKIYIAYAIPINETRGIYLTSSADGGLTWSSPTQVVDGHMLNYEMINDPRLSIQDNGGLQLMYASYQFQSGQSQPLGLYYVNSSDGGVTWSQPAQVTDHPVLWSAIISTGATVHRFWQDYDGQNVTVWHEISADNGATWTRDKPFSFLGQKVGTPSVSSDTAGRLHLLQMVLGDNNQYTLQHVMWDGSSWINEPFATILVDSLLSVGSPAETVSADGYLAAVFPISVRTVDPLTQEAGAQQQLLFTGQLLDNIPAIQTGSENTVTLPVVQATQAPTDTIQPTAVEENVSTTIDLNRGRPANPTIGILAGVVLSILVIAGLVSYRLFIKKPGR